MLPHSLRGVELAVLKVADGSDNLVARLVERRGHRATAKVSVDAHKALLVPCLATETEDVGAPLAAPASIALGPYEIKTLRVSIK